MPFAKEPFRDPSAPLFEQRMNELEKGEGIGEITTAKLPAEVVTGEKVAPAVVARRNLLSAQGMLTAAEALGTYFFLTGGGVMTKATALKVEYATTTSPFFKLVTADWTVTGRTPKLAVRLDVLSNAKAPGATFVAGLYQVEKSEGATGKNAITYKAVVAGSTATVGLIASEGVSATSTSIALPSENYYALGVEVATEALKAESQVFMNANLVLLYS